MPDTTPPRPGRPGPPTVAEIAALTARLRRLSNAGTRADDAEREAFLADKNALLDRIAATEHSPEARAATITTGHATDDPEWHPLGSARLDLATTDAEVGHRSSGRRLGGPAADRRASRTRRTSDGGSLGTPRRRPHR